jgi:hypothetical protein
MHKTIVLGLLENHAELHEQLRRSKMLLSTLNLLATQLKSSHESWKDRLLLAKPGTGESQLASEALEMAVKELEDYLGSGVRPTGSELLSPDEAMAFIRGPARPT